MTVLQNFPMVSQLTQVTSDGKPSENAQMDCVAACICAGIMYFKGVHQVNTEYNPDKLKDVVYGDAYKGGTDAAKYVEYCASLGVKLLSVGGNAEQLIADTHQNLAKGLPTILTILDPYVPASYGWTHAIIAFADGNGEITALDPYIAKGVTKSDSEWDGLLRTSSVWVLESGGTAGVPAGWHDTGTDLTDPGGGKAVLGFRAKILELYQAGKWDDDDWIDGGQYPTARLEDSNPALGGGDQLLTRKHLLGYPHDPQGAVAHLKNQVIVEYLGTELGYYRKQAYALLQANKQLQAQIAQLQQQATMPQEHASVQQFLDIVAPLYGYKHL